MSEREKVLWEENQKTKENQQEKDTIKRPMNYFPPPSQLTGKEEFENPPWLDLHLAKFKMDHLWDIINDGKHIDVRKELAGNISKSESIEDKNNWFYENALKECTDHLFYKEWNNYYNVHVTRSCPPPVFKLEKLWVNYQKQHEFNPPHNHTGAFSFVVFMKIPTDFREQHALPWLKDVAHPQASNFEFLLGYGKKEVRSFPCELSPEDEGRMFFFPAWVVHQVFPFYGTEEERITVSGNINITKDLKG